MEAASVVGKLELPPGYRFVPEDEEVVAYYLLRRLRGLPLPLGVILEDDPLSAPPWLLLEKHGRKGDAFFFAAGQAVNARGSRQKRSCAGGGTWENQSKCVKGKKLRVPGSGMEVEWQKSALNFHEKGVEGSTGWVMHEYAITAPPKLAASPMRVYRIRFSGHGRNAKKRTRDAQDWGSEDEGEDGAARATTRRAGEDTALFVGECPSASQSGSASSSPVVVADPGNGNPADGADAGAAIPASTAMPPDHDFSAVMDGSLPVSEMPENNDDFMFVLDDLSLPDWFPIP